MRSLPWVAVAALAALFAAAGPAAAQQKKIVCWTDKSGKVVGCGDTVPPEYRDSATKVLDRRGVTRATTESVEEAAKRRAQEQDAAKRKAEEEKRLAEQRRRDAMLLATYSNEREIDQKRDRELQQLDLQIGQLRVSFKAASARYEEAKARAGAAKKDARLAQPALTEELARAAAEKERLEKAIAAKEKEKEGLREHYAEQKRRFAELKALEAGAAKSVPAAAAPKK